MNRFPSAEHQKNSSSPPGGSLQKAATTSLAAAWLIYSKSLSGPVSQIVPEPTRQAVFQLFCDIRANVPKDKRFLQRHAKAFTPQTKLGWLALSGVLGYVVSAALLVTTLSLVISVAGLSIGVMTVLATGAFLASALGFMAFVLFTSAFVVGAVAFTALSGYVVGSSSLAVMRHITQLVFGGNGSDQPSLFSSEEMHQSNNKKSTTATTISVATDIPGNITETEKPTTPTSIRHSTYAAPRAVLPPIKTASPTKKRSPATSATSLSLPSAATITTPRTTSSHRNEVTSQSKESPASSPSTFTAAKCNLSTPTAVAVETALAAGDEIQEEIAVSLENDKEKLMNLVQIQEGERPAVESTAAAAKPMESTTKPKNPKIVAIQSNTNTTPSGVRTITTIKPNTNGKLKTSFLGKAPLPTPTVSTTGHLKPPSPVTSSSSPPIVNSISKHSTIDSNNSSGAFASVMQEWKEIEKKEAMESRNGGEAKLPSHRRNSKNKRKPSKNKASLPLEIGEATTSTLDPKTPGTE